MFQHHRLHQSHEDAIAYRGDDLLLLGLGLAQTLVEASADDVLQDLPGLPQLRRGRVQDLLKQVICKQRVDTSVTRSAKFTDEELQNIRAGKKGTEFTLTHRSRQP